MASDLKQSGAVPYVNGYENVKGESYLPPFYFSVNGSHAFSQRSQSEVHLISLQ